MNSYLSESPSPTDLHDSASALPHSNPPQSQERFPHSDPGLYPAAQDRVSPGPERLSRQPDFDKYHDEDSLHNHLLDHRRMSEPAVLNAPNLYAIPNPDTSASSRYQHFNFAFNPPALHTPRSAASLYLSPLQRGASTGSLRDLRDQHFEYPPQQSEWKHREPQEPFDRQSDALDEPISPMQPNFSGGLGSSPTTGVPYSPLSDNLYGPSPPGTGTSTSSSAPLSIPCSPSRSLSQHLHRSLSNPHGVGDSIDRKTYSFVALPGNAVKKRPRRRYDEIERLYQCSWPDCNKSYGTLNHLNAHVTMQKHGVKRSPNEFKELRKQWRKAKKESEAAGGIVRRDSYIDSYDDNGYFDQRYLSSHSINHRPHSSHHPGLPSSVSIPHSGTTDRYSVSIDDIRYPTNDRDDGLLNYGSLASRQRYSGNLPSSWHGGSHIPSRPNIQQQYLSSSFPNQPAHHSQLPQLSINSHLHQASSGIPPANRLPQNSTLLMPLPGYQTTSLIPLLQSGNGLAYATDAYEVYDDDSNSRPGTGHTSIGAHSGDEFDH
ncbi:hypothetical protein BYT27DRAFT_7126125 [Phlegmacium glaucopus]|nr:hypothetical protein BYT27DRAFT_7126125 [Phlegmacium glaucopus]